jgi:hypothetical protein
MIFTSWGKILSGSEKKGIIFFNIIEATLKRHVNNMRKFIRVKRRISTIPTLSIPKRINGKLRGEKPSGCPKKTAK